MWTVVTGSMVASLLLVGAGVALADPYFNSSECRTDGSGVPSNPNHVRCDDFEDGVWYATGNDGPPPTNPANKGWFGCNDAAGTNSRACRTPPPPQTGLCDGNGAAGTNCTARSSPQGGNGGNSALAMGGFYPSNATYRELYFRMYQRFLPGYVFNNNQKFISYIDSPYKGGIDFGGGPTRDLSQLTFSPQFDCLDDNYRNPQDPRHRQCYIQQNQGKQLDFKTGRWYYVEWHIRLNDFGIRNGTLEAWIDDCGPAGTACTGTPTKRMNFTNVGWRGPGTSRGDIGSMWFDIWGNPADVGTVQFDQLVVSRAPIGFMTPRPAAMPRPLVVPPARVSGVAPWAGLVPLALLVPVLITLRRARRAR